jgi:hypothetical protein
MKRLFAAAAIAPLSFAAAAHAQTSVSTATTAPLATSSAGDITVTSAGSILVNSGVAVTINSDNKLNNQGGVIVRDAPTATAILVDVPAGGRASTIDLSGTVGADDTKNNTDTDNDGDLDGAFTDPGVIRYGVRVTGPGVFTGNINQTAGAIGIKGVDGSAAVAIESAMVGDLTLGGQVLSLGDRSYGLRLTGPLTGDLLISGSVSARGKDAVAVSVEAPITGQFKINGTVTGTGFRYETRPTVAALRDKLDADDLLIGGPAVHIKSSISEGFLLYGPPGDLDPDDKDEDDDGIEDANQGASGAIIQAGSAPGLLIGDASNIALGNVGTGPLGGYGVSLRGSVTANGTYDGVSATGVQIGGLGGTVTTGGGVLIRRGLISGIAYGADAIGLRLGSGAVVPLLQNDGTIQGSAVAVGTSDPSGIGVRIDAGSNVPTFVNNGSITSTVAGPKGTAIGLVDTAGNLTSITNTGSISAALANTDPDVPAVGAAIALDLRNNTAGVNFVQSKRETGLTPSISGHILLGTGAGSDTVDVQAGAVLGNIVFGGGTDAFKMSGGSLFVGGISKSSGDLSIDVAKGVLSLSNTDSIALTSLNIGEESTILFNADPTETDPTFRNGRLNVSGTATLAQGARIGLNFASRLTSPTSFTVIQAGTLNNLGADDSLLGNLPFIYSADLVTTSTTATINVRQKTTDELGLAGGRAAAFSAFYEAIDKDQTVLSSVFGRNTEEGFDSFYNQFLPDYAGGIFHGLAIGARGVMRAQAEEVVDMPRDEPRSWLQEVGSGVSQKSPTEINYRTTGFGLAGGYEVPIGAGNGVAGVSLAYLSSDVRNQGRSVTSTLDVNSILLGGYWRDRRGNLLLDASLNGGYLWVDSNREVIDQSPTTGVRSVQKEVVADWSGFLASGRLGAAYDWQAGAMYLRPDIFVDYIYLREGGYTETGGGGAIDLQVDGRSSYQAAAEVGIAWGARFGRTFRWGPELRVAYRSVLAGGLSDTTARFVSVPGQPFSLSSIEQDKGVMVVMAGVKGSGAYSNFAFEAGGELGDLYRAYMARLVVRFLF